MAIEILCETDGGLGNRLGGLVDALWLKDELEIPAIKLKWVRTHACAADWDQLFYPIGDVELVNDFTNYLKLGNKTWLGISGEEFRLKYQLKNLNETSRFFNGSDVWDFPTSAQIFKHIKEIDDVNFIYVSDYRPFSWLSKKRISEVLKRYIKPQEELMEEVNSFCMSHQINSSVVGVHIRGTDGYDSDKNKKLEAAQLIERELVKKKKVFVCTDAKDIDDFLKDRFENKILSYPKRVYVDKCDEAREWRDQFEMSIATEKKFGIIGAQIRTDLFSNVLRSAAQMRSALCDMYILARTQISEAVVTQSTFLDFARYLAD